LLDSGADITAVPAAVADRLGLVKFSDVILAGYAGPAVPAERYVVDITLHDFDLTAIEVVLTHESYVIVGRDILNQFHITLDGPHLRLEIQRP
jgi:predicted aspartyl protease